MGKEESGTSLFMIYRKKHLIPEVLWKPPLI